MGKFINPFSDYGFKAIFGREVSKDLIISFLNGVLQNEVIVDITFRNVELLGLTHDHRRAIFDIFCENEKGEFFIVEMQKSPQKYFSDRVLYYASFTIQQQTLLMKDRQEMGPEESRKRWCYNLSRVYVVCILNYVMEPAYPAKYRWDIVRMDRELKIPFSETLNEIYLEMPKFVLSLSECDTIYKKWLYVLNNIDIMERLPDELNNQIFQKLKRLVEIERMPYEERLAYEVSLKAERDLDACMATQYEYGVEAGEAKGKEIGLAEGLRKAARNMKEKGMDIAAIMDCTGLDAETVAAL